MYDQIDLFEYAETVDPFKCFRGRMNIPKQLTTPSMPEHDHSKTTPKPVVTKIIEQVAQEICNKYCKYPDIWDEAKEGCELSESKICEECPLNWLA